MSLQFTGRRLRRWTRPRTTTLNDFVVKDIQEAQNIIERNSPTRCAGPQPVGLVFQKPLHPAALHVRVAALYKKTMIFPPKKDRFRRKAVPFSYKVALF